MIFEKVFMFSSTTSLLGEVISTGLVENPMISSTMTGQQYILKRCCASWKGLGIKCCKMPLPSVCQRSQVSMGVVEAFLQIMCGKYCSQCASDRYIEWSMISKWTVCIGWHPTPSIARDLLNTAKALTSLLCLLFNSSTHSVLNYGRFKKIDTGLPYTFSKQAPWQEI